MRLRKSSMFLSALQKNISGFFLPLFIFMLLFLLEAGGVKAQTTPVKKTVLVLSPFQFDLATNLIAAQTMREEFGKATDLSLDVYYEYLDFNRFSDSAYQQKIFDLLIAKYKNKQVDLVVVGSETMLYLWLTQRAEILPNTPIVFFDVFTEHLNGLELPANMTGVSGTEDCTKSIRWFLDAMPEVNEVVLVMGAGKIEQGFFDHIQKLQENMKGQVKFTDLSGLPLAEISERVAKLPKTSIVFYHPMFEDAEGNKYRPLEAIRELTIVSSVPVMGGYDQFIGTGIIGGYMYSIDQQARDAAQISLRILRGETSSSVPIAKNQSDRFVFDHLALQRFDIPLSLLPTDSIVKNRQYSFWELYRAEIILVIASFTFLMFLVVILGITTKRLSQAKTALNHLNEDLESQVQERTAALSQNNRELELEIAERKQAEEQLRESEERFRSLLDSQEGNIMVLDFDGMHHYANQVSVSSIKGSVTTQDIIGKRLHDLYPARVADWQLEQTQRVFTTGQGFSGDFEVCMEDQISWWHLNLQPVRNGLGQVVHVMVNSFNITERKQMEDALRESESRFRGYFELPLGGRAITSPTKGWLDVNSELCDMLGYTKAELMQMTWAELTHPDDIAIDMAQFNRVMAGEIDGYTIGKRFIHKSGRSIHTHLAVQCMRHPDQTVDYFMALLLDITKLKQAEEEIKMLNATLEQRVEERTFELVHANRVKDEFLASMSHELRTPLNAISGYSQLLLEGLHGSINERQQRDLGIVRSSCDHLLGLITDILDVSKIESGQFTLHLESVDVNEVCKASMVFVNQFAEQKNIEMDYSTSEDEPVILADAKRLKQILVNLLNNAVKFTPEKGRIKLEVRTDVSAGLMRFSVTDTGIGISAEDLPKLFKPFVQLDGSLSRQYQGTGLGLSLVKRLVEIQGGSVDVQSEAGVGSCFTFVLPWQDVSMDNKGRDLIVADDQNGRLMTTPHAKVLIADDNEVNVMVVRDYLESFGYQVSVAFDGAEVLSKVEQEIPDVILMDIQMPHVNGVELTRRLRFDPRFATVPIIALTALALSGDRERCFEAGMNEYMSKPVSLKEVRTMVERFLIRA